MIQRGFAAAAKAILLLRETAPRQKGHGISYIPLDTGLTGEIRIGVFACRCNDSFGWSDEMKVYLDSLVARAEIVHAEALNSACIPEGVTRILDVVREKALTRIVLASCVCCPLDYVCSACTDQRSRLKDALFNGTGISRSMVQTCNLRGEDPSHHVGVCLSHHSAVRVRHLLHQKRPHKLPAICYGGHGGCELHGGD